MNVSLLSKYVIQLSDDWIDKWVSTLSNEDFSNKDLLLQAFLNSDIALSTVTSPFPPSIEELHDYKIQGPYILQVNEIHNIGENCEHRNKETAKRCLKLFMSDGKQKIVGMEYQRIPELKIDTPPGCKIAIANVTVRRGMLLLTEQNVQFLGGKVEGLVKLWEKSNGIKEGKKEEEKEELMANEIAAPTVHNPPSLPSQSHKRKPPNPQRHKLQQQPNQLTIKQSQTPRHTVVTPVTPTLPSAATTTDIEDLTADEFYDLPPSPSRRSSRQLPHKTQTQPIVITDNDLDLVMVEQQEHEDCMDFEGMEAMLEMEQEEDTKQTSRLSGRPRPRGQGHDRQVAPQKSEVGQPQHFSSPDGTIRSKKYRRSNVAKQPVQPSPHFSPPMPMHEPPSTASSTQVDGSAGSQENSHSESPIEITTAGSSEQVAEAQYILSFNELPHYQGKIIKIQAEFVKKEVFKIKKARYHLIVQLKDQAGDSLSVRISNELLQERIFGIPAAQFHKMMSSKEDSMREKVQQCSAEAQAKLESLGTREIRIQIPSGQITSSSKKKIPVVTSL